MWSSLDKVMLVAPVLEEITRNDDLQQSHVDHL